MTRTSRTATVAVFLVATVAAAGCSRDPRPNDERSLQQERSALSSPTTFTLAFPIGGTLQTTILSATANLLIDSQTTVGAPSTSQELASFGKQFTTQLAAGAHVNGNVSSVAPVSLGSATIVTGLVRSAAAITAQAGAVTGGATSNAVIAQGSFSWTATIPPASNVALNLFSGQSRALSPGVFGPTTVFNNATLSLGAGTYFFQSFDSEPGSTINLDETHGPVLIYVNGTVILRGALASVGGIRNNLLLVSLGTGTVDVATPLAGTIVALNGTVNLDRPASNQPHVGQVFARQIELFSNSTMNLGSFAGWGPLLCGDAPGLTIAEVQRLPLSCNSPNLCCHEGATAVDLADTGVTFQVPGPNSCVFGGGGADVIVGCAVAGSTIQGGAGNDNILVGEGTVVYGGAGNDVIESFGNSVIFGNDGDDVISAPTGNNVIIPGAGKDQVITGDGDDIVVINDECEIVAGERISTGAGHDVVISPVDRAGLVARGVILVDVEEVRVERHSCQSQCRNPPQCSGVGTCVEATSATGALTCACPPIARGAQCESSNPPPYIPSTPPTLQNVPAGAEAQTAVAFTDWYYRSAIGDGESARTELRAARGNPPLRDAFIAVTRSLLGGPNYQLAAAGLDIAAFMQCQGCEQLLRDVLARPIPSVGLPAFLEHNVRPSTTDEFAELAIQRTAINGLAFQTTRASKDFLLAYMTTARSDLRRSAAHALIASYGSAIRSDVLARLPPAETLEAYRLPNYSQNFSQLFGQFVSAAQQVQQ